MKIELLYADACPNWRATLEDIAAVVEEHHLSLEIELVQVTSTQEAEHLAFPGSPTVRVDGVDVDLDAPTTGFGLDSRVYLVEEEPQGRPPKEWIAAALESAIG